MYKHRSIEEYLNDLAAKLPAPGGGSAAALGACLGVSLISMVVNFTLGKPKYARYESELKKILLKSEKLRESFLNLVDLDVIAYQNKNTRDMLDIPFMAARLCFAGVKLCPPLIKRGNINLISDVAVAAIMLESAFAAAYFNVLINLKPLGDKKISAKIERELKQKARTVRKIRTETEGQIDGIIRG